MAEIPWHAIGAIGVLMLLCTLWHICTTHIRTLDRRSLGTARQESRTTSLSPIQRFEKQCRDLASGNSCTKPAYSWVDEHTAFDLDCGRRKIWYTWLMASPTHSNFERTLANFVGLTLAGGLLYYVKLDVSATDVALMALGSEMASFCVSAAVVKRSGGTSCISAGIHVFNTMLAASKVTTGLEELALTAIFGVPAVLRLCDDVWHFRDDEGVGHAEHFSGAAFGLVYALAKIYGGMLL